MASNQVYSQGFNFSSFIQKGVDPRTGQYTCAITLYEAPAQARNCPPLKLSISYNPLNSSQDIGLGKGWSFNNLSYYQHRQSNTKSLFLSTGEHFQVTETSSGSVTVKDRKLKSFLFKKKEDDKGKKTYQIIHKSGQIEVLHNTNDTYNITVPVKIYAANGRLLKLKWTRFGEQPRLSQIQEGSQVLLELKYSDSQVTIVRSPNTAEASTSVLVRRTNQLVELKLPREKSEDVLASWKFTYKSFNNGSIICLSTVSSPAGLLEQVQYKSDGHRLPEGAPYETIPYVISHTVQPRGQQPAIKTTYSYSHRNFLGYDGGVRWKGGEDNLYRVPDEYKYTSTVQMEGGAKTEYTYNKFHLIIDTLRRKGSKEVTQHIEYYALKNKGFKDQPAQYQLPKIARTTYRYTSAKKQEVSRTETSRYSFDEWGNPTSAEEPNGIKTDRVYYPAAGEKDTTTGEVYCPANPHLFQLYLKQETVTPAASEYTTLTRSKHYTYRELPTAAGALTGSFVVAQQIQSLEDNQCVFSTQYTYTNQPATEDHGRLQQQTTSLFGQSKYSTTTDWMYQYDPNNSERLTQTTQTRTFDGHTIQDATSYSRYSGLALTHKDQAGVDTVFEYNKLNRLVKTTLAPGTPYQATRQYEYGALSGESGYQLTLTDAKGVRTRYITDGLERLVRVEKQDDDGSWDSKGAYSGTFRLVQKRNYNTLGQHIETVDIDWLRSNQGEPTKQRQSQRMEYDDWGQVCKITQSTGVVISSLTDPIELTRTEGVEGEGQNKIQSNLFGAPTQTVLLKRDGTVYSKFEYAYDGLGRLVKQKDQLGRTTQYQADCFDRSIQTREPDGRIINTQYATQSAAALPVSVNVNDHAIGQQSFDGLCRVTSRKVGVRTTAQSYQGNAPKPSWITTPKGGQYNLTHEPVWDYALTKLTSSDSSNAYKYDSQTATMLQSRNEYSEQDLQYFPSGLVARETIRTKDDSTLSTQSTYSMSGKLQCYTDVHGQKHEIQYDDFGRPQCLVQGKLRVTFSYDQKDRLCENCVQDEENNQSLTTSLRYDDFSREIERAVRKGEETLYRLSQAYGETSLITTRKLEDGQGNLLRHETFQYDAHNRLIDYQCNGSQPPADEYGHGLQHQQFSFDNYNNLTQVFTTFQDGTTNIKRYAYSDTDLTQVVQITNTNSTYPPTIDLAYDENGCLTRDERGRILEYDTLSRLSTVRDANTKEILAQYRYDSAGKLVCQEVPGKSNTYLHYRANALVALTVGDSKVSYISDGQVYWGQSLQQDGQIHTQLWSSDAHQSILAWLDTQQSEVIHHQSYTPYGGSAAAVSSIGFNGQWRDPVTGWYHLGNGYRVYNPVLMRFHTPDRWSPFTSGEINPYAYCLGDPINRIDPSGHLSIFGIDFSNRDLAVMGVGLGIGILVGILTAGAGFAIAAGVASDVATGFLYDVTSGKSPTWASVGTDALYGVIGGIAGEALGVGLKAASRGLSKILGRSASLTITEAESQSVRRLPALEANVIGRGRLVGAPAGEDYFEMAYINNLEGVPGHDALVTHGNWVGQLMCWNATRGEFFMTDAARVARYNLVRNANPELRRMANAFRHVDDRPFTLLACHGATSAGQVLANVLNRDVRCFYGRLQPNARFRNWDQVFHRLQREGGIEDVFGPVESVIRRPQGPPEPMEIL